MARFTPERLAQLRIKRGLSQAALAELVGVSSTAVSHAEMGRTKWGRTNARKVFTVLYEAAPIAEPEVFELLEFLNLDKALIDSLRRPKPNAPPVNDFLTAVHPMLQDMLRLVGPQVTLALVRTIHATVITAANQPGRVDPATLRVKTPPVWNAAIGAYEHTEVEYTQETPGPKRATRIDRTNAS